MTIEYLLSLIDIELEEIPKATHYFQLKGIDLHHYIFEYIKGFKAERVKYCEIASVYRYDKRIRKVLYKYIALFEEYLRAYISNSYSDNLSGLRLTKALAKHLSSECQLFKSLDKALFSELIAQVLNLSDDEIAVLFDNNIFSKDNLKAINELRNAVSHNRFLLNYLSFEIVVLNGEPSGSLYGNLINFSNFLPENIRQGFLSEINDCRFQDEHVVNKLPYQTRWLLPEQIVLIL